MSGDGPLAPDSALVSIVICCYNRARFLPATLDSALSQDYPHTEIILYDDGSTDDTAQVAAQYGDNIRYVQRKNLGVARARTAACQEARGQYIAFLDDDDLMPPSRISLLFKALQAHPTAKFAVGELAWIDEHDAVIQTPNLNNKTTTVMDAYRAVLWPEVPATVHTTLFRREDGEAIDWFDHDFHGAGEDKDFFARLGCGAKLVYVPEVVSLYRRGHASLTADTPMRVLDAQMQIFSKVLSVPVDQQLQARMHYRQKITLRQAAQQDLKAAQEMHKRWLQSLPHSIRLDFYLFAIKQRLKALLKRS